MLAILIRRTAERLLLPNAWRILGTMLAVALLAGMDLRSAAAQTAGNVCAPALVRPQDDLWLVNQRGLGCVNGGADPSTLRYWHYVPGVGWQKATSDNFYASDKPDTLTQIWIHGNRIDYAGAFHVGWTVYSSLARRAVSPQPLRFVIWSWPSDQIRGLRADAEVKAARTLPAAFHLARFIDRIGDGVQVGITAYSYGARIGLGALQLLAGGPLGGQTIALRSGASRPLIDVVLIAAAADAGALLPGNCNGKALNVANRLLLVTNSCDKVLRFYRFLYGRRSCIEALGRVGLGYTRQLGANAHKVAQFDACCLVGPEHYWANYFASPPVVDRIEPYVFAVPTRTAAAGAVPGRRESAIARRKKDDETATAEAVATE